MSSNLQAASLGRNEFQDQEIQYGSIHHILSPELIMQPEQNKT